MMGRTLTNDPAGDRTQDLRIKRRERPLRAPNDLASFHSAGASAAIRIRRAIRTPSATNRITSGAGQ